VRLLIVGAGGHGRVVADLAEAAGGWGEIAFLDDDAADGRRADWPLAGTLSDLARLAGRFDACVAATGNARLRLETLERAEIAGFRVPVLVHPRAAVSARARLGAGTVVCAGSVVGTGAVLGRACIVNTGATIDHDCRLDDGVHVCPGAHLAGNVSIGSRTWFGIGAIAKQGLTIGADVTVGAGAVCIGTVPDGATVVGVPAREKPR
jgi:sugar O-acyltransferase (sialic acid O-acetyltransferase NeuD family)